MLRLFTVSSSTAVSEAHINVIDQCQLFPLNFNLGGILSSRAIFSVNVLLLTPAASLPITYLLYYIPSSKNDNRGTESKLQ